MGNLYFLVLDPCDVCLRNHVPRQQVLLQTLIRTCDLMVCDQILRRLNAFVETILRDLVDKFGSVNKCKFLRNLLF